MARHLLSDIHVRNAKPKAKPYRVKDGDGLFLYIPPSGICAWQFRYKLNGKHQTLTLGKLSNMGLAEARRRAGEARAAAADGKHLTTAKRVARANLAATQSAIFESIADAWIRKPRAVPWSDRHGKQVRASIDNHLSGLNGLPVTEITAKVAAPILGKVERSAPMMFEKVRRRLYRILDHAVVRGDLERNPLPAPEPERRRDRKHYPAVTDLPTIGQILRDARAADPAKGIQRAHILSAFTAQRIAEIAGAHWSEFDLDEGVWTIPRHRMKEKETSRPDHQVPLPPLLWSQIQEWREADGDNALFVCPAPRDSTRHITETAVEKHYRVVLGLKNRHSPHSWRSALKTIATDAGKASDVIEAQLDHIVGNKTESAYDRAKRLKLRRKLMTWYEEQLVSAQTTARLRE
jgi:integrase